MRALSVTTGSGESRRFCLVGSTSGAWTMTRGRMRITNERMGPRNFWIGLPVVLFFAAVTGGGAYYALNQVYLEWQLDREGITVQGTLREKRQLTDEEGSTYHFRYTFTVDSKVITHETRVDAGAYHALREGDPIEVVYLPGHPECNLPANREMSHFFLLCGAISAIAALFFLVVTVGMIIKKIRGGYGPLEGKVPYPR